jgi:hypothetical protein
MVDIEQEVDLGKVGHFHLIYDPFEKAGLIQKRLKD